MKTARLDTTLEALAEAGAVIRRGGLVAFPTETVYGLGANALDEAAVRRVYEAKGRPSDNPMIVHIADEEQLEELVEAVRPSDRKLIEAFWPGPITFVFAGKSVVPKVTTGGLDTVAVRMPSNETARALIRAAQRPIAAPSANLSGKPSPTTAEDVLEDMDGRIDAVLMGERCAVGIESTVLDLTEEDPVVLRPGYVTKCEIEAVLGRPIAYDPALLQNPEDEGFHPKAPGMKYRHYAPKAEVKILAGSEAHVQAALTEIKAVEDAAGRKTVVLDYRRDSRAAAKDFFARLRELDRKGIDLILIAALDEEELGFSVMNRMLKSAGYEVIHVEKGRTMNIAIGCDHAGFPLKEAVKEKLEREGYTLLDLGTDSTESVDYPLYGRAVGEAVTDGRAERGIVICGSGIGISIAANKVKGVRCALCTSVEMAEMSRRHNDANVLAMGARMIEPELAFAMIDKWFATEFEGGKHLRRINMLED